MVVMLRDEIQLSRFVVLSVHVAVELVDQNIPNSLYCSMKRTGKDLHCVAPTGAIERRL